MKSLKNVIGMACMLPMLLVACGGGNGDGNSTASDPVNAYVGQWRGCLNADAGVWQIVEVITTKSNAFGGTTQLRGLDSYSDAACKAVRSTQNDPAQPRNFSLVDAVNVQGKSGHRLLITGDQSIKYVYAVSGNQLFIGDTDGPFDSHGFPTTLINEPLIKQ